MNAEYYAMLLNKLRNIIWEKRSEKLTRGVQLLRKNVPVHTAAISQDAIRDCGSEQLNHPPYSSDMDYFLFPNHKKDLRGRRFSLDEKLKAAIMVHFEEKTSLFLRW